MASRFLGLVALLPLWLLSPSSVASSPEPADGGDDLAIEFYYRETRNVLAFSWFGDSDDVRAGVDWYFVTENGTEIRVAKMDWQGYHLLRSDLVGNGAVYLQFGPPRAGGNRSRVYVAGWLEPPVWTVGHYRVRGYGRTADVFVTGRTLAAVSPNPDKFDPSAYRFDCLRPADESKLPYKLTRMVNHERVHWWNGARHLVTYFPSGRAGVAGTARWSDPPDYLRKYQLDLENGGLKVFDTESVVRLGCLRCTRQGPNYSSLSMLSCRDPPGGMSLPKPGSGSDPRSPETTSADVRAQSALNRALSALEYWLTVAVWVTAGLALLLVTALLVLNGLAALARSSCCSRLRAYVVGVARGASVPEDRAKVLSDVSV